MKDETDGIPGAPTEAKIRKKPEFSERQARPELTIEDVRRIVDEARASGTNPCRVPKIMAMAKGRALRDGPLSD